MAWDPNTNRVAYTGGLGSYVQGFIVDPIIQWGATTTLPFYGNKIDISGDTIVLGHWTYNGAGYSLGGRVVILRYNGSTWEESHTVTGVVADERVGYDVAITEGGNVVMYSNNNARINILKWNGSSWIDASYIQGTTGIGFGRQFNVDGDKLIVGAPNDDTDGFVDNGAAYIYQATS
jgi:hypothetical protein